MPHPSPFSLADMPACPAARHAPLAALLHSRNDVRLMHAGSASAILNPLEEALRPPASAASSRGSTRSGRHAPDQCPGHAQGAGTRPPPRPASSGPPRARSTATRRRIPGSKPVAARSTRSAPGHAATRAGGQAGRRNALFRPPSQARDRDRPRPDLRHLRAAHDLRTVSDFVVNALAGLRNSTAAHTRRAFRQRDDLVDGFFRLMRQDAATSPSIAAIAANSAPQACRHRDRDDGLALGPC